MVCPFRGDEAVHRRYLRPFSVAKKGRGVSQDLPLLAQLSILSLELAQAGSLIGGQAGLATGVDVVSERRGNAIDS